MLAEEEVAVTVPVDIIDKVLEIELVNGTGLFAAVRGDEMIYTEFSIGESKVFSSKKANTLHPVWNEALKLQFIPLEGKSIDLQIKIIVDVEGRDSEVASRKLKGLEKTLQEGVPFNALDFKFGKDKRITFSLAALNFGLTKELTQARKLSIVAEEFSKYIVHLYVILQVIDVIGEEKLLKLQEDLDCENYLVRQKRVTKEDFVNLDSEISLFKKLLKDLNYNPKEKLTREMGKNIREALEKNTILFEMFKSFTESMKSPLGGGGGRGKKKGKVKGRNYVRSFIKGVKKRGKRLSNFKRRDSEKQGYEYKGNVRFIFRNEVSLSERRSDFENRGKWKGRDVLLVTHPTGSGKNIETIYIKLQLLAKLSQELPIPRIYGIVSDKGQVRPQEPSSPSDKRQSMNEMKVARLENEVSLLVDDEPPEFSLHAYLNENTEPVNYEMRKKIAMDVMESLKLLHDDEFKHGYLTMKSMYFRVPMGKKRKKMNVSQVNPNVHPLILGRAYLHLVDQAVPKPIPREEAGFLAPEIIQMQFGENRVPTYTEESDVFSFGMCLFLILGGKLQRVYHRQYGRQPKKTLDYTFPKSYDDSPMLQRDPWVKDILTDCFEVDPTKRPSMRQILRRFVNEDQVNRGPALLYCKTVGQDDADSEEMSISDFTMRGLREAIKKAYGEKSVVETVFENKDSGEKRELRWNQDVYELKENALIVVKFAPEGTKMVYPDEEEEEDLGQDREDPSGKDVVATTQPKSTDIAQPSSIPKIMSAGDGDDSVAIGDKRVSTGLDGPKLLNKYSEELEESDDEAMDDDEEYSMSGEDSGFEREPIVFYLRSSDEDDDDADDYLLNDFTMSELKSLIFKEREGPFIKKIVVKKDDGTVHELFIDKDLKDWMDEDDMVIVYFGSEGEEVITFETRYKKLQNMRQKKKKGSPDPKPVPTRKAPTVPGPTQGGTSSFFQPAPSGSSEKMIVLQSENMKIKEELEQYKKKCGTLEKTVEELTRTVNSQKKEIAYMKERLFKEF